ncbi:MAG TPA: Gfo/Idh/MocA family oxidoreductase [Thermoanaerobaculia bacterium]
MLRGALVGLGNVARNGHLPAWLARPDVEIAAAADVAPGSREAAAEMLPGGVFYGSAEELLSEERLDFVDICTPPSAHAEAIRLALDRGLHVLCEKPLVLDRGALADLSRLAAARDRALAAVHNWRHAPAIALATEAVRSGRIGSVRRATWEVLRERPSVAAVRPDAPNWRLNPAVSGGGILVDHGWHAAYVLAGWMAEPLSRVGARLETRRHREFAVEDTADVQLEFGDARASVFLSWAASERKNRVSIEGTEGAVRIGDRTLEIDSRGRTERRELEASLSAGSHHADWFAKTAAEFVGEIREPETRGRSLAESAVCLEVIRLAQDSHRLGGTMLDAARASARPGQEALAAAGAPGRRLP